MKNYTKEDIIRLVEEEDVEFIRLQFTDILGTFKNMAITSSQLEKILNHECSFDPSQIGGFPNLSEKDLYLHPDFDTFEIFPWRPQQGKVARLICAVLGESAYTWYLAMKKKEWDEYKAQVSEWELQQYLNRY